MTSKNELNKPSTSLPGRKMFTNKHQFKAMISFIEKNKSCFLLQSGASRGKLESKLRNQKWNELKELLNKLGPPVLEADRWKRVWKDWKYNVRLKIRKNLKSNTRRSVLTDDESRAAVFLNIVSSEQSKRNNLNNNNHKKDNKSNEKGTPVLGKKRRKNYVLVNDDDDDDDDDEDDEDKNSLHSSPAQLFMPLLMKQMESQTLFLQQISETFNDMKSISAEYLNQQKKNHKLKKHLIAMNET